MCVSSKKTDDLDVVIRCALSEDTGDGDVTTLSILPADLGISGEFKAKEDGVIAGLRVVRRIFEIIDPGLEFVSFVKDGAQIGDGDVLASVKGKGQGVLDGERTALNFLQRMSGIATTTSEYVKAVAGTKTVILDTRKTAPGLRALDKEAVRIGGGKNHRFGLFDMVLIKENHIAAAGCSITEAVRRVREADRQKREIEVEVRTLDELRETVALRVDRIMLDNMSLDTMREAVSIAAGRVPLEASGNVTLSNVRAIADTGVDFISVGALTHSVKALDMTLLISSALW